MSDDEAKMVIAILETADDGCSYCVGELLDKFFAAFPDKAGLADGTQSTPERHQEPSGPGV